MKTNSEKFLTSYKINLNAQQRRALERIDGQTLLLAVPGSGKTTVIISRLGYMIKALGIHPDRILTLTFSRLGVADLKKRYRELFGEEEAPRISTIHSFALGVIRTCQKQMGRVKYEVLENRKSVLAGIYRELKHKGPTEADLSDLDSKITLAKNLLLSEKEQKKLFGADMSVKEAYEKYKTRQKLIDFDDMLLYAYRLLKKNPGLLKMYKERFDYIQIDEAQDNSKIQDAIIRLLTGEDGNLFMVADEDQSIYGFRGAYPDFVLNFKKYYPKSRVVMMESNYRATESLTEPAGEFIRLNEGRYDKNMVAVNGGGIPAEHRFFKSIDERDHYIINCIRREAKDTAVLFRNNDSAVELVDILEREKIPFNLRESNPLFFSNFLMRDLTYFYRLAKDPADFEAFSQIYYKCSARLSRKNFERFRKTYRGGSVWKGLERLNYPDWLKEDIRELKTSFEDLYTLPPEIFLDTIFTEIGYQDYLDYRAESSTERERVEQKKSILETLAGRQESVEEFFNRLGELKEIMKVARPKTKRGRLTLSTIHGAKGLEFEKVLMIDVNKNILPAPGQGDKEADRESYLEEVRLFYVGVTRAKRELEFLSIGSPHWQPSGQEVSPFIDFYFNPKNKKR